MSISPFHRIARVARAQRSAPARGGRGVATVLPDALTTPSSTPATGRGHERPTDKTPAPLARLRVSAPRGRQGRRRAARQIAAARTRLSTPFRAPVGGDLGTSPLEWSPVRRCHPGGACLARPPACWERRAGSAPRPIPRRPTLRPGNFLGRRGRAPISWVVMAACSPRAPALVRRRHGRAPRAPQNTRPSTAASERPRLRCPSRQTRRRSSRRRW